MEYKPVAVRPLADTQIPDAYFNANWYVARNPDVALAGMDPLSHYLNYGEQEDRSPCADFDTGWYRKEHALEGDASPLAHYLRQCSTLAVNPNPGFDVAWYAHTYRHFLANEPDPFQHYLKHGMRMGCDPSPEASIIRISGLFDLAYYRAASLPLETEHDDDLIYHFCREGWKKQRRRPNHAFDIQRYLDQNHDVAAAGLNPLYHYICYGEAENRQPFGGFSPKLYRKENALSPETSCLVHYLARSASSKRGLSDGTLFSDACIESKGVGASPPGTTVGNSGLFDQNFYLINYPDVRESSLQPLEHFMRHGWREGRRPNPYFDPAWYAAKYLAGEDEINPLVHYIQVGEYRSCRPIVYFDPGWYRARYLLASDCSPLRHYLAKRRTQTFSPNMLFEVDRYVETAGRAIGRNRDPFLHYLRVGVSQDVDPSPAFNSRLYRLNMMSTDVEPSRAVPGAEIHEKLRREALNPLIHFLLRSFATLAA